MDTYKFKDMQLTWLDSTSAYSDGGATFGPVPKAVWAKKYPSNDINQVNMVQDPILIQYQDKNYLIDAGFQTNKLDSKQRRNNGIVGDTELEASLNQLNLSTADIDGVLMTHMHNDHASGLTTFVDGYYLSTFQNAVIYINEMEWDEVRQPNIRTKGTYLKENWEPIQDQVVLFQDFKEIAPGIEMHHTGGHSKGLSIVRLIQDDQVIIHLSDLLLTTASFNPAWVSGYDDYPMDSVHAKEYWLKKAFDQQYKFIFYHDPYYCLLQLAQDGKTGVESVERSKVPLIGWPDSIEKLY
ncbi:MBL fold metallo-hydrolase [Aerococcaceae bacterium WGS1372]